MPAASGRRLYGVASVASISVSTPCLRADLGEPFQIDDAQVRIRRRLADQQLRLGRDRRFHRVVVAGLHLPRRHAEPRQVLRAELAAAVITLVEEDHFVAGVELRHQQADDRRHAAGVEDRLFAPFERGQLPLDDLLARIAVAAILFARLLLLDEVDDRLRVGERVGRGAEDRIGDRVARLLPRFAGMNASVESSAADESLVVPRGTFIVGRLHLSCTHLVTRYASNISVGGGELVPTPKRIGFTTETQRAQRNKETPIANRHFFIQLLLLCELCVSVVILV